MVTLVLPRTVISMDNIVINIWLTYALLLLVIELNEVRKTGFVKHVVVLLAL